MRAPRDGASNAAARARGPETHPTWFEKTEHRFYKRVKVEAVAIATAVAPVGRCVSWPDSFYATNAINSYLPAADGKRADQVPAWLLAAHARYFRLEISLMAEHRALPDLVLVFCRRASWGAGVRRVERRFDRPRRGQHRGAAFARWCALGSSGGPHGTLLVRMRHPSARTMKRPAKWLLAQPWSCR